MVVVEVFLVLSLGCTNSTPTTVPAMPRATLLKPTATFTPVPLMAPVALARVAIEGVTLAVELAVTPQERSDGLSGWPGLERDKGMLFVYAGDSTPGFWMRGVLFPLDIVWIDAEGVVAGVEGNLPMALGSQPPVYYPPRPIRYVLEINAGLAGELGIGTGSHATFEGIP
jgi:uncharacterized membrane protein (UPF0127 family)